MKQLLQKKNPPLKKYKKFYDNAWTWENNRLACYRSLWHAQVIMLAPMHLVRMHDSLPLYSHHPLFPLRLSHEFSTNFIRLWITCLDIFPSWWRYLWLTYIHNYQWTINNNFISFLNLFHPQYHFTLSKMIGTANHNTKTKSNNTNKISKQD